MKQVRIAALFLIFTFFFINLVPAQGCDQAGWKGYGQLYENKTICVTCTTCDSINFSLTSPDGNIVISDAEMNKSGNTFCNEFDGQDLAVLGTFQIDGYSQLETPLGLCFDITLTGQESSIWAYIMSIVFVLLMLVGLIGLNIKFPAGEREKLYHKIVIEYFKFKSTAHGGNLGYALLYLIAYGMLRMIFVFYYLIILLFIFIFNEMVMAFGINTFAALMPQILVISFIGLSLIGIIFISMFLKIIRSLLEDVQNMLRGIDGQ